MGGSAGQSASERREAGVRGRTIVVASALIALGLAAPPASAATIAVHCATQNLQTKINSAAPGASLSITGTCHVNATINKDITLQGNPTATLDGDDLGSTITISGTPSVHLTHLVVTGGRSSQGGGIDIVGGTVTLLHMTVQDNLAEGSSAQGGGIYNAGALKVVQSTIAHNRADATHTGNAADGDGGGIESTGSLKVSGSSISSNRATANATNGGGGAFGGGILEEGGVLTVTSSHFTDNHVEVAADMFDVSGYGGAIADVSTSATATITSSTLDQNAVVAVGHGAASAGAGGGALLLGVKTATVKSSTITGSSVVSTSDSHDAQSTGGALYADLTSKVTMSGLTVLDSTVRAKGANVVQAFGGGLFVEGTVSIAGSSISGGSAEADGGASQAQASGGGILIDSGPKLTVTGTTVASNKAIATQQSAFQAVAQGGGILSEVPTVVRRSTVSGNIATAAASTHVVNPDALVLGGGLNLSNGANVISDSTIAGNVAKASTNAAGGTSASVGGGIQAGGSLTTLKVVATTLTRNVVEGSGATVSDEGGGIHADSGTTTLQASILAGNTAPTKADGPNCAKFPTFQSAGHNLIGTTSGCVFAKQSTDKVNVANPGLGPLAHNGGPTETIALTAASPARNAFVPPCTVTTDQRGVHRPQGPRCDIGAFERS
jgi:hypothetical protein